MIGYAKHLVKQFENVDFLSDFQKDILIRLKNWIEESENTNYENYDIDDCECDIRTITSYELSLKQGFIWVVGGIYKDFSFSEQEKYEEYGPFKTYQDAYDKWKEIMWLNVDNALHKLIIWEYKAFELPFGK